MGMLKYGGWQHSHNTLLVQAPTEEDCTGTHTSPETNWTQCPYIPLQPARSTTSHTWDRLQCSKAIHDEPAEPLPAMAATHKTQTMSTLEQHQPVCQPAQKFC